MTSTPKSTAFKDLSLGGIVNQQPANASTVTDPFLEAEGYVDEARETVSVSATDANVKTLDSAIVAGANVTITKINTGADEQLQIAASGGGGGGGMTSFDLAADTGTATTVDDAETVSILGGTGLSSAVAAGNNVTVNLDDTAVSPGSYTLASITVDAQGRLTAASSGSAAGFDTIILRDEKASGNNAGTFTNGAWRTRDLNVEDTDTGNHCTLSANQFTLAEGTYIITAYALARAVNRHQSKLRNITDSVDTVVGGNSSSLNSSASDTPSIIFGRFTVASGGKTFEIQHQCEITVNNIGFGINNSFGTVNIYTQVILYKVS